MIPIRIIKMVRCVLEPCVTFKGYSSETHTLQNLSYGKKEQLQLQDFSSYEASQSALLSM